MRLRDLTYLVAVADHGSFRKAAAALGIAQPTLSVQIKKLEDELGTTLVDRSAQPLRLTTAGSVAVERARTIIEQVAELETAVCDAASPDGGTLRLGAFPTLAPYLLPRVMGAINERFPDLQVLITEEKTENLISGFDELDAILIAEPDTVPGAIELMLFTEEFLFATASNSPLAGSTPIAVDELRDSDMLLLGDGHCLAAQVEAWLTESGVGHTYPHRATSLETLRSMVASGVGNTLLPALAVQSPMAGDNVSVRRVEAPAPTRAIKLVWRAQNPRAELIRRIAHSLIPASANYVTSLLDD